jgi:hypothetical protein
MSISTMATRRWSTSRPTRVADWRSSAVDDEI